MNDLPHKLQLRLDKRAADNALRTLETSFPAIDFSSNDYLGFAKSAELFAETEKILSKRGIIQNGATGSRLISGNSKLCEEAENSVAAFHDAPAALIYNSGYDANVGFFSSVPQRGDLIFFDEYSHASIRDGIRLSTARAIKFPHNDLDELERRLSEIPIGDNEIYIATESVFSMDGDSPQISKLCVIAEKYRARLIIDEAHAVGVFGSRGEGFLFDHGLQHSIFARIVTFGKAIGSHGAAVLCSEPLREYLVNFSRSFIYSTGLSPHTVASALAAYSKLAKSDIEIGKLRENILVFSRLVTSLALKQIFVGGKSAIQSAIIPGNARVRNIANQLQQSGFDVRAILSPTVPEGQERLRFCIHSFNTVDEIEAVLNKLAEILIHDGA